MFKKRVAKRRNPIEIVEQAKTSDGAAENHDSAAQADGCATQERLYAKPSSAFRKRDVKAVAVKLNKVSTATQDDTSKAFMQREVQDLTNNYKSSSQARAAMERNRVQTEVYLREEEEKDGLFYAKQNQEISRQIREGELNDKVYRGQNGYSNYFVQTEDDLRQKKFSGTLKGPQKAPTFVKVTTRVDHNPERCKDYYEHGYCGFGDTCIFIHDRGDYKSGHQLDTEYEQALKKKQLKFVRKSNRGEDAGDGCDSDDAESNYEIGGQSDCENDSGFPSLCAICERGFQEPVMTKCKHYFCDSCAIKNYASDSNCFVCGQSTDGIFNTARDLIKYLKSRPVAAVEQDQEEEMDPGQYEVAQSSSGDEEQHQQPIATEQEIPHHQQQDDDKDCEDGKQE